MICILQERFRSSPSLPAAIISSVFAHAAPGLCYHWEERAVRLTALFRIYHLKLVYVANRPETESEESQNLKHI